MELARLGAELAEPIRNGYSPVCPAVPTGRWILHLGSVGYEGFNPQAVKPAPVGDSRVDGACLRPGDVLVSRSNTRERVGLAGLYRGVPSPCSYPDLLMRVRAGYRLDSQFLVFSLLSHAGRTYFTAAARGTSGSMVKIDRKILESFPLMLPPLLEQRKIAAILSSVDEAIEATDAVIAQLQVVKKATLAELLTKGLPGRHTRFKSTDVGDVPESWRVVPLGEVVAETAYGTSAKCRPEPVGSPVLRIPNVVSGRVSLADLKYAMLSADEMARYALIEGDMLIVRTNGNPDYVGRSAVVPSHDGLWLYASYLIRVKVNRAVLDPWFLHPALQADAVRGTMKGAIRTSAGNYNLNTDGITKTLVPLPELSEQREIVSVLDEITGRLDVEYDARDAKAALKSALMSVLLTGEIRVRPDTSGEAAA